MSERTQEHEQQQPQQERINDLACELKNVRETTTKEIAELRKRITELEEELDRRDRQDSSSSVGHAGTFDKHDAAVLDVLDGREGEVFIGRDLIDLYRSESGIRRQQTLKRRAKDLFRSPVFEMIQSGRGRFVGSDGGEE